LLLLPLRFPVPCSFLFPRKVLGLSRRSGVIVAIVRRQTEQYSNKTIIKQNNK